MSLFSDSPATERNRPDTSPKHNGILREYPSTVQTLNTSPKPPGTPGRKPSHENPEITMKHAAFAILRDAGAGPTQAARVLGYSPQTGSKLEKRLNAYEIKRDKLLSSATQTVEKFIKGKPVGQVVDPTTGLVDPKSGVHPKGSDVMRAVELVMDREQPKVQLSASITAEFCPVDLSAYE